jgi:XTP/dITP diphosphohydrolase
MKQVVIASNNSGKIAEIAALLRPLGVEPVPQSLLGVAEADEPHPTFVENAIAKARNAAQHTGVPALADDSGICVAALGGAPGVISARYGGEPRSDERNNRKLVHALAGVADRSAYYFAVLVLMRHPADPQPLIAEGRWSGQVIDSPRVAHGFGYDPYFLLPELGMTAAELPPEQKNRISHRALALRRLAALLQEHAL